MEVEILQLLIENNNQHKIEKYHKESINDCKALTLLVDKSIIVPIEELLHDIYKTFSKLKNSSNQKIIIQKLNNSFKKIDTLVNKANDRISNNFKLYKQEVIQSLINFGKYILYGGIFLSIILFIIFKIFYIETIRKIDLFKIGKYQCCK